MYKPEITNIIIENLRLGSEVAALTKGYYQSSDVALLNRAEQIQNQIALNHKRIESLRV